MAVRVGAHDNETCPAGARACQQAHAYRSRTIGRNSIRDDAMPAQVTRQLRRLGMMFALGRGKDVDAAFEFSKKWQRVARAASGLPFHAMSGRWKRFADAPSGTISTGRPVSNKAVSSAIAENVLERSPGRAKTIRSLRRPNRATTSLSYPMISRHRLEASRTAVPLSYSGSLHCACHCSKCRRARAAASVTACSTGAPRRRSTCRSCPPLRHGYRSAHAGHRCDCQSAAQSATHGRGRIDPSLFHRRRRGYA
jgi:hypothetical protein